MTLAYAIILDKSRSWHITKLFVQVGFISFILEMLAALVHDEEGQ